MSAILHSLKFVKRLNVSVIFRSRRLCSLASRASIESSTTNSRVQCLSASIINRNYVTQTLSKNDSNRSESVEQLLHNLQDKIMKFNNIQKQHIDEILQIATKIGSLTSTQALFLIRCCGDILCLENVNTRRELINEILEAIKVFDVKMDVSHYNALLQVHIENEVDFSPATILMEMKEKNIEPNRVTFQRLIDHYCNKGDIIGATKVLEHMNKQDIPINENIFNSLIKGHSQAGDTASAVKLLDIMTQSGISPSSNTYTAILCTYAKSGDIESIRTTLNDCKNKDILISDKQLLEVIYQLEINEHSEYVDEIMTHVTKGKTYNRDMKPYINKLIEKNRIDSAYKLAKTLKQSTYKSDDNDSYIGDFFIHKLITSGSDIEKMSQFCNFLINDKLHSHPFEVAVFYAYKHNEHHMSLSLLKTLREIGGEIREHYFYPLLVKYGQTYNLQGSMNIIKSMILDFQIYPRIDTVQNFVIPYMVGEPYDKVQTLVDNKVTFITAANAALFDLLKEGKMSSAENFINQTHMVYNKNIIYPLVNCFLITNDVKSFVNIIYHQCVHIIKNNTTDNNNKEKFWTAKEYASEILTAFSNKSKNNHVAMLDVLNEFVEKNLSINYEAAEIIKNYFNQEHMQEVEELLSKLTSNNFTDLKGKSLSLIDRQLNDLVKYAKLFKTDEIEKLLLEIEKENPINYNFKVCIALLSCYLKLNNLENAEKWWHKIRKSHPDILLTKAKIITYAVLLIKNNRASDALKLIQDTPYNKSLNSEIHFDNFLSTVKYYCPDESEQFLETLKNNKYLNMNRRELNVLMEHYIETLNIEKAIETYKFASETANLLPLRTQLMKTLIKLEDPKSLQTITDISIQVAGEVQTLHDLTIAFFECNRPVQARKILETPGLKVSISRIMPYATFYSKIGDAKKLEKLINLFENLYINLNELYILLLKTYDKNQDWNSCLALWTKLQEDNVIPSHEFMTTLESILKKYNQDVPFVPTQMIEELDNIEYEIQNFIDNKNFDKAKQYINQLKSSRKKYDYLIKLMKHYIDNGNINKSLKIITELFSLSQSQDNIHCFQESLKEVVKKLIDREDFSNIQELTSFLQHIIKNNIKIEKHLNTRNINFIINSSFHESGKYLNLLNHLDNYPVQLHTQVAVTVMQEEPEVLEKLKNLADNNNEKAMNIVAIHEFANNNLETEEFVNKYIKTDKFSQHWSLFNVCNTAEKWELFPKIVELVKHSKISVLRKQDIINNALRDLLKSNCPKKYELAFEFVRHAIKVIDLHNIKPNLIDEIEKNLTNGQTIYSLKKENESMETTASG